MPFSSLNDPADIAKAQAALDAAWSAIKPSISEDQQKSEYTRLAYIVAASFSVPSPEDDLAKTAIARFASRALDR
jgi:hypothetical protein